MAKNEKIHIKGTEVLYYKEGSDNYISITDIAKVRDNVNPAQIISLWLRTYSTIEYLGLWESLHNTDFKPHIYEEFKNESAKPHFWMSPTKWINETMFQVSGSRFQVSGFMFQVPCFRFHVSGTTGAGG